MAVVPNQIFDPNSFYLFCWINAAKVQTICRLKNKEYGPFLDETEEFNAIWITIGIMIFNMVCAAIFVAYKCASSCNKRATTPYTDLETGPRGRPCRNELNYRGSFRGSRSSPTPRPRRHRSDSEYYTENEV